MNVFLLIINVLKQGHAPSSSYFMHLENPPVDEYMYMRRRDRVRKWFCCNIQDEESYPSQEELLRSSGKANGIPSHIHSINFFLHMMYLLIMLGTFYLRLPKGLEEFSSYQFFRYFETSTTYRSTCLLFG